MKLGSPSTMLSTQKTIIWDLSGWLEPILNSSIHSENSKNSEKKILSGAKNSLTNINRFEFKLLILARISLNTLTSIPLTKYSCMHNFPAVALKMRSRDVWLHYCVVNWSAPRKEEFGQLDIAHCTSDHERWKTFICCFYIYFDAIRQ